MGYVFDVVGAKEGLDGVLYGKGDIIFSDGRVIERWLVLFTNGHVHGGNKDVIIYLATSKDDAAHAWRTRENAGTL